MARLEWDMIPIPVDELEKHTSLCTPPEPFQKLPIPKYLYALAAP